MRSRRAHWHELVMCAMALVLCPFCVAEAQGELTFRAEQADSGEAVYRAMCASCHGASLFGTPLGPALFSDSFVDRWAARPLSDLFSFMKSTMPPGGVGGVSDESYAAIIAYILERYGVQSSAVALPSTVIAMNELRWPRRELLFANIGSWNGGVSSGTTLPSWPARADPLRAISNVTDELLVSPPEGSWLSWRRTLDAAGFSPLRQITKDSVKRMRVAWTLALPSGPNESAPLVHDGVMFVHSFGDNVQALDAVTGDELWRFRPHSRTDGVQKSIAVYSARKNIALYGDKLYLSTAESHVIALKIEDGSVAWDWPAQDERMTLTTAGPTVVDGVVVQGAFVSSSSAGVVVGLDAQTGKLLWQFNTVIQPGEPNRNSWNDVPPEKRSGGHVWLPGSYDPKRKVVLLGPAPTYDTLPLREPVHKSGVTNDALYTNATIALEPKTGRLVWFYQHLPNDQWDLDWAFERQLIELPIDGMTKRIVLTSGKPAIYDAIDADTGHYLFSMDLGLQNIITGIDPITGKKSVDRSRLPGAKERVTVCPHTLGAKSWLPASYDMERRLLYVPLVESCMDMVRIQRWGLLGGVRVNVRPVSGSDGKYGRLQAINLETRKTLWTLRQRAPQTSGVLATAGGVLFAGALDRWFSAYDSDTGMELWRIRLSDVPNSSPISYVADGRQYVAIVVGHGGPQSVSFLPLVPEIHLPAAQSSAVWVFEVPESLPRGQSIERASFP